MIITLIIMTMVTKTTMVKVMLTVWHVMMIKGDVESFMVKMIII